jgi:LmbE family N-acetylglucosaminyl deacetylase
MKKVMFIAVHPDDETLGCGGTILKHKAQGDEIYWLTITNATKDHPFHFSDEFVIMREQLVDKVALAYGFNETIKLDLPTQMLHTIDLKDFVVAVDDVIKRIQPNVIYMPFRGDVHSDHRIAFDAIYSCTKSFRKPFVETIYMLEALSETEFSPAVPSTSFVPNVFVDITEYMDRKIEIMSLYDKEVMSEPYPRSLSSIRALARVRGSRAGVMYAEAFMLLYERR